MILTMILTAIVAAPSPLPPCPAKPNCVSTQATGAHAITPLRYRTTQREAMQRLLSVLRAMPRTTIVESTADSVRVEFRTRIFRFVDDAQFVFDDREKKIDFRSASRVGHSDLGVNRRRMEELRRAFDAAAGSP